MSLSGMIRCEAEGRPHWVETFVNVQWTIADFLTVECCNEHLDDVIDFYRTVRVEGFRPIITVPPAIL